MQCGEEFVLEWEEDRADFGRAIDSHMQDHHQELLAVLVDDDQVDADD